MKIASLVKNALTTRTAWLSKLLDPRRDIDRECGHPEIVTVDDYSRLFKRGDLAARIISLFPEETWSEDPVVFETEDETETEFEKAWKELDKKLAIFSQLQRADVLSGVGRFGVVLLGIDDGKDLQEPIEGIDERGQIVGRPQHQLLYLRPFDESLVRIESLETSLQNPRYGQPTFYQISFSDTVLGQTTSMVSRVHWSRIVHIVDNRTNSDIYGQPRLEKVINRVLDLHKIAGGSGEMFWKGGFPGISLESQPSLDEDVEFDKDATKEQIESYMNGLQRYIATVGMTAKSLTPNVADPMPHLESQLKLIASAMGVPWRVLVGSEAAQLASEQDTKAWNKRINRRRTSYVTPFVIRPFVDRLIALGALPEPGEEGYQVEWQDLNTPSEDERATVAEKRTNALAKYVAGGVDVLVPPFHYLTLVLGMPDDEAEAIISASEEQANLLDGNEPEPESQSGEGEGNEPPEGQGNPVVEE